MPSSVELVVSTPALPCPFLSLCLSFPQVVGPLRADSLELPLPFAVQRIATKAKVYGDDDDNMTISGICK